MGPLDISEPRLQQHNNSTYCPHKRLCVTPAETTTTPTPTTDEHTPDTQPTTTTTTSTSSVSSIRTRPRRSRTFTSRMGLIDYLRIHHTEASVPVPGAHIRPLHPP
ncbi:hypothetical protein SprV_0100174900 [Sparganum proliferum]